MNVTLHRLAADNYIKIPKGSKVEIENLHGPVGITHAASDNTGTLRFYRDGEWMEVSVFEGTAIVGGNPKFQETYTIGAGEKAIVFCRWTGDAGSHSAVRVYALS